MPPLRLPPPSPRAASRGAATPTLALAFAAALARTLVPALALASFTAAPALRAADQPHWGQAWSRNLVSDEKNLPVSFDPATGANLAWTAELGTEAHATPVVARGRVLVGTNNNRPRDPRHKGDRGVLFCLDEKDGRLHWQLVVPKITGDIYLDWPNDGICSPPTVDGDRVYAVTNRGEVVCLDLLGLANGNDGPFRDEARHQTPADAPPIETAPTDADILWLLDLHDAPVRVYQNDAFHTSPLLLGRHLYLNTSNGVDNTHKVIRSPDAPSLVALDASTGRLLAMDGARIGPRIFHCTWSAPALGRLAGRDQLLLAGGDGILYAFDPLPGDVSAGGAVRTLAPLWTFDGDPDAPKENVATYLRNRKTGPSNVYGMPVIAGDRVFLAGGGDLWWGKTEAWLACIDPGTTEPGLSPGAPPRARAAWLYRFGRHTMTTPAVHDGLVYATDTDGRLHCLDAATGAVHWIHEAWVKPGQRASYWASPVVADGRVYVGTRHGLFLTFEAGRTQRLLASVELGSPISACAVAANGTLYVTTMNRLYAARRK